jgi:hypothetical protein
LIEGFGCLVVLVVILGAGVAINISTAKRNAADVHVRVARIHTALGRLSHRPGSQAALDAISSAVGDGQWLLRPAVRTHSDMWSRALIAAFGSLSTADGRRVLERLVVPLASSSIFDPSSFLQRTAEAVSANPDRRDIHEALLNAIRAIPRDRIAMNQSEWLYQQMLGFVKQKPSQADVAVLTLDIGRWHCSRTRADGKVTVYDEQMIQNDIAVRRAGS